MQQIWLSFHLGGIHTLQIFTKMLMDNSNGVGGRKRGCISVIANILPSSRVWDQLSQHYFPVQDHRAFAR